MSEENQNHGLEYRLEYRLKGFKDSASSKSVSSEQSEEIRDSDNEEIRLGYKLTKVGWIPDDWDVNRIDELAKTTAGGTPKTSNQEYWNGEVFWMSSGDLNKKIIREVDGRITKKGLAESSAKLLPINSVLIGLAGQGKTRGIVAINKVELSSNQSVAAIIPSAKAYYQFLYYNLDSRYAEIRRMSTGDGGRGGLNLKIINSIKIPLPDIPEQKAIAQVLSTWDKAIESLTHLITEKQQKKKALMQQLLTGKKRFPGFDGEWKEVKISDIAKEYSKRNKEKKDLTVLSCTKYDGLVPSLEYFGRKIYSDKLETYKVVKRNTFAYATNHINEGSIGFQNVVDEGLISPMYTCFDTDGMVDKEFFFMLLKSHKFLHEYERRTEGSIDRRGGLRWQGFSGIKCKLPAIDEQQKIAKVLNAATKEIELLNQKPDALKDQKKGLMQQLLTGKKRMNYDLND